MNIYSSSLWASLWMAVRAGSQLVFNKLISVSFGPEGITLMNHFLNLVAMVMTVPQDGIGRGSISAIASVKKINSHRAVVQESLGLVLVYWMIICLAVFSFPTFFLVPFRSSSFPFLWSVVLIFLFLLSGLQTLALALINAKGNTKRFSLTSSSGLLLGAVVAVVMITNFPLAFALLALLVYHSLGATISLFVLSRAYPLDYLWPRFRWPLQHKVLLRFVGLSFVFLILGQLSTFVVRSYAMGNFSVLEVAEWQTVTRLSNMYFMPVWALLGAVFYPQLSNLIPQKQEAKNYIRKALISALVLGTLGLGMLYMLGPWIIEFLFIQDMVSATKYLPYQVIGDWFKIPSVLLSNILLAQAKTTTVILTQISSLSVFFASLFLLLPVFGIEGIMITHVIQFIFYFILNVFLVRKWL